MIPDSLNLRQDHAADWVSNLLTKIPPPIHIESKGSHRRNMKISPSRHLVAGCVFQGTIGFRKAGKSCVIARPSLLINIFRKSGRRRRFARGTGLRGRTGVGRIHRFVAAQVDLGIDIVGMFLDLQLDRTVGFSRQGWCRGLFVRLFLVRFLIGHGEAFRNRFHEENERVTGPFHVSPTKCSTDCGCTSANGQA